MAQSEIRFVTSSHQVKFLESLSQPLDLIGVKVGRHVRGEASLVAHGEAGSV
jgi:hypothetical protein